MISFRQCRKMKPIQVSDTEGYFWRDPGGVNNLCGMRLLVNPSCGNKLDSASACCFFQDCFDQL